jgi:hypothetical protein
MIIKRTLFLYVILTAIVAPIIGTADYSSAGATKKNDDSNKNSDSNTLTPEEQSKKTATEKEDSTVDMKNGDKECKPGGIDCGKPAIHCPPGFKPKHGVCNKDVFITVHGKGGGSNKSPSLNLINHLPDGCNLLSQKQVSQAAPGFIITVKCNA